MEMLTVKNDDCKAEMKGRRCWRQWSWM